MSSEKRVLVAFALSVLVFIVWSVLFPPPQRAQLEESARGAEEAAASPVGDFPEEPAEEGREAPAAEDESPGVAPAAERVEGEREETIRLANDVLELTLTNRGSALRSIVLKGYEADGGGPLDLVETIEDSRRSLPMQLVDDGEVDTRLYATEAMEGGVRFVFSDGLGTQVTKEFRLPEKGYQIGFEMRALGELRGASVSVGTGMRDTTESERKNRCATWGDVALLQGSELVRLKREKVKETTRYEGAGVRFAGFEDTYFLSLFQPASELEGVQVEPVEVVEKGAGAEGEETKLQVLKILLEPDDGELEGDLLAAPKEYQLLREIDGGVDRTVDFGFFHPISVFFLKALRWTYERVHNFGLAIILLTLAIRIVLFPLMHQSTVSMRKMQKLQPKLKAIQEKYKKNRKDPQVRAKMSQETMALYKTEGVNPMGGCLPMLVQLPILWALYMLFAHAIELRHAPFILWIQDLSAKDPYYVTPILMTATMWLQQRLAPQAGDPQQQRIFRLMPLIFGIMFMGFPSGLVLYWLANNVITILQQEVTLHLIGERKRPGRRTVGGKGRSQ